MKNASKQLFSENNNTGWSEPAKGLQDDFVSFVRDQILIGFWEEVLLWNILFKLLQIISREKLT